MIICGGIKIVEIIGGQNGLSHLTIQIDAITQERSIAFKLTLLCWFSFLKICPQNKKQDIMQKITPFLWFNNQAEEAVDYYVSVFKDAKKGDVLRHTEAGPGPAGTVLTVAFTLFGQEFVALNGGPQFNFTEAVSFVINCETQKEVDYYWERLIKDGGEESMCGWLKDKYGLSWQVTPVALIKMISDKSTKKADAAMQAMMKMKKLDLPTLQKAYDEA